MTSTCSMSTLAICTLHVVPRRPNSRQFCPMNSPFRVTTNFDKVLRMTPKLSLSEVPTYMYLPDVQLSVRFALGWAVFELQPILRKVHWRTPTWPLTCRGQRAHIHTSYAQSRKFSSLSLYDEPFSKLRPNFEKKGASNIPKWSLTCSM